MTRVPVVDRPGLAAREFRHLVQVPTAPVEPFIRAALINSIKLAVLAFVIVVPLGIVGGVIAALYEGRSSDRIISRDRALR